MSEEKELKSNLLKHMKYNIFAFALILTIFALFMFFVMKTVTYVRADNELINAKNEIIELNNIIHNRNNVLLPDWFDGSTKDRIKTNFLDLSQYISNPRINMIVWDENGNLIMGLGSVNDYIKEISFEEDNINKVFDVKIGNDYNYRAINFMIDYDKNGEIEYCQILLNIDTERFLVTICLQIIVVATVICIICSIMISYFLSKNTIKPIAENMRKHTEFVQNASHELRTPLTIIQAKQELLLDEPDAKIIDKIEDISITLEETKRLTKITKDLLLLTRADNKNMTLQKEDTELDEFVSNIIKNYVELAEIEGKKISINTNFGREIKIDRTKIHELLVILIDNAIKYTEEGDCIEVLTYSKDNKCIIEVKDTGIGVSEEGLKRIFERFYRDDKARNRETGGTGLGLSIASTIVKSHGGTIKASHNEPKGTVFTVKIPIK